MATYRDSGFAEAARCMAAAQQAYADSDAEYELARLKFQELERRRGEAAQRLEKAVDAYQKARWGL